MTENLKSDRESKNETTHAEYSRLETKKPKSKREIPMNTESKLDSKRTSIINIELARLETKRNSVMNIESLRLETKKPKSKRETTTNTESKVDFNKRDSKNKGNIKLDSSGDEIIWEIKPKYYFFNTFTHIIILALCIILLCVGVFADIFTTLLVKIVWSIFFGFTIYHFYDTLFGMVCFYVTNSGIGFERRKWFRMQKRFFKFGEVEVSIGEYQVFVLYNHNEIFIAPLNTKGWHRRKNIYRLHFLNFHLSNDKKVYEIWDFIRKKSQIALESKGIDTNSINFNTFFICFTKE